MTMLLGCTGNPQRIAGRVAIGGLVYWAWWPGQLEIAEKRTKKEEYNYD